MCTGIACSFHDVDASGEPCTVEYYGKIQNIVEVNFTSFTAILLKGDWYDSKATNRGNPRVLVDECKFTRVRTSKFMPSNLIVHEPFVFPLDVDQVFFIEDRLNTGWHLVVKYDARTKKVLYMKDINTVIEGDEDNLPVRNDESNTSAQAFPLKVTETMGELVSMEFIDEEEDEFTDDSGGEGEFQRGRDPIQSSTGFEQNDLNTVDFDVHAQEVVRMLGSQTRATFERYIGDHLIGEDTLSDSELEDANVVEDVVGHSESVRE